MKRFLADFKKFIMRGNVIDLAVGVIIGGAFGNITTSLVKDIITPVINLFIGDLALNELRLGPLLVGNFIEAGIDFLLIAFVVFMIVKFINSLRRIEGDKISSEKSGEEQLLSEIRDILKEQKVSS